MSEYNPFGPLPKIVQVTALGTVTLQFPYRINPQGKPAAVRLTYGQSYELDADDLDELDDSIFDLLDSGVLVYEIIGYNLPASQISYQNGDTEISVQEAIAGITSSGYAPYGSEEHPEVITSAGITSTSAQRALWFIEGDGPTNVTSNPQITPGTMIGQELTLYGMDDTNTVTFHNNNGLVLNGACVLQAGSSLGLIWSGVYWREAFRNDI
jgi:hypothetical protein